MSNRILLVVSVVLIASGITNVAVSQFASGANHKCLPLSSTACNDNVFPCSYWEPNPQGPVAKPAWWGDCEYCDSTSNVGASVCVRWSSSTCTPAHDPARTVVCGNQYIDGHCFDDPESIHHICINGMKNGTCDLVIC